MGGHQYQTSQINSRSFFFRWQIEESSLLPPHEKMNQQPTAKELTKVVGTNQRTHNSAILRPICICLSRSLDGWIGGRYQQQQQSATIKSIYNNTKTRNDILRPCSFFYYCCCCCYCFSSFCVSVVIKMKETKPLKWDC